jgi:hypothetical protein
MSLMKTRTILFTALLCAAVSCEKEKVITDPVYEFVSFKGDETVSLNEFDNSIEGYPVVIQLWAFKPYSEDIDVTLEVTGSNTEEDVDFTVTPDQMVTIPAGSLTSDTLWIKTINNEAGGDVARTFDVKIKSTSKSDLKIGLGISAPKNDDVAFNILDDECSGTPDIYNADLKNILAWGYGEGTWDEENVNLTATGSLSGDVVTVHGDLIYYDGYIPGNISLPILLTPQSAGAVKGKATFGELDLGNATDGYHYRLLEIGEGSYDICSGKIDITFDLQYEDGADWVNYYYVHSVYSIH